MLKKYMKEFGYTDMDIELFIGYFIDYGFDELTEETLYNKMKLVCEYLISIYSDNFDVIKMTKIFPELINLDIGFMKQRMDDLVNLGYKKEDFLKMIRVLPYLLRYSLKSMKHKISSMMELGYSYDEIIELKTYAIPLTLDYGLSE